MSEDDEEMQLNEMKQEAGVSELRSRNCGRQI